MKQLLPHPKKDQGIIYPLEVDLEKDVVIMKNLDKIVVGIVGIRSGSYTILNRLSGWSSGAVYPTLNDLVTAYANHNFYVV